MSCPSKPWTAFLPLLFISKRVCCRNYGSLVAWASVYLHFPWGPWWSGTSLGESRDLRGSVGERTLVPWANSSYNIWKLNAEHGRQYFFPLLPQQPFGCADWIWNNCSAPPIHVYMVAANNTVKTSCCGLRNGIYICSDDTSNFIKNNWFRGAFASIPLKFWPKSSILEKWFVEILGQFTVYTL